MASEMFVVALIQILVSLHVADCPGLPELYVKIKLYITCVPQAVYPYDRTINRQHTYSCSIGYEKEEGSGIVTPCHNLSFNLVNETEGEAWDACKHIASNYEAVFYDELFKGCFPYEELHWFELSPPHSVNQLQYTANNKTTDKSDKL